MQQTDIDTTVAGTVLPTGYTFNPRTDPDTGEHIMHVDGPNGWFVEIMHKRHIPWLVRRLRQHNQGNDAIELIT